MPSKKSSAPIWLFDLDNTLHDASHAIFPAIHQNMNAYLAQVLGANGQPASDEHVSATRESYLRRYGATVLGMMKHHAVVPAQFQAVVHRLPELAEMIRAERGLARLLRRLPGKKILFTNAPFRYSRDVLSHLGLHRHFDEHISIESMWVHRQLRPKPSKVLLRKFLSRQGLVAGRCILVEDTQANLKSAKALGMRTVWVTQYLKTQGLRGASHLDVRVKSVRQLPQQVPRLTR
jgi:putative hydrolase of the HAD superfamily